jgi:hypothetical protein
LSQDAIRDEDDIFTLGVTGLEGAVVVMITDWENDTHFTPDGHFAFVTFVNKVTVCPTSTTDDNEAGALDSSAVKTEFDDHKQ